jgi:DNA-binding NarL/FixJ family response regulator
VSATGDRVRVLLVDDQALFREALATLLGVRPEIEVVGEAGDGDAALRQAAELRPDVVLMDLHMPVLDGIAATRRLRVEQPGVRVLALTTFDDDEDVFAALRAGAVGYLLKDAATGELELALRSVMRGESWLSPAVSRQVVEGYVQRVGGEAAPDLLTARQREVLRLVAGGKSTKEIAFLLNLSVKTVETHRAQIMERLGIRDVAGLVRYALRTGLVPPES